MFILTSCKMSQEEALKEYNNLFNNIVYDIEKSETYGIKEIEKLEKLVNEYFKNNDEKVER
jgi:hypothetical protein